MYPGPFPDQPAGIKGKPRRTTKMVELVTHHSLWNRRLD